MKRINMVLVLLIGLLLLPNSVEKVGVDSLKYQTPANSAFDDDNFYRCVVDNYNSTVNHQHSIQDYARTTSIKDNVKAAKLADHSQYYYDDDTEQDSSELTVSDSLTAEQLQIIYTLNCDQYGINSTKGIERLTNLETLYLRDNNISEINLTKNIYLSNVYLTKNKLTSLNISKNSNLYVLDVSGNPLNVLDVSKNPGLETVFVDDTVYVSGENRISGYVTYTGNNFFRGYDLEVGSINNVLYDYETESYQNLYLGESRSYDLTLDDGVYKLALCPDYYDNTLLCGDDLLYNMMEEANEITINGKKFDYKAWKKKVGEIVDGRSYIVTELPKKENVIKFKMSNFEYSQNYSSRRNQSSGEIVGQKAKEASSQQSTRQATSTRQSTIINDNVNVIKLAEVANPGITHQGVQSDSTISTVQMDGVYTFRIVNPSGRQNVVSTIVNNPKTGALFSTILSGLGVILAGFLTIRYFKKKKSF